uniref:Alpha 1,4-glycosyltransferase domain-containing protein n=1 Tax=Chromera velia CCMP2878 TaxID=1169474 RepID=A0A0G4GJT9_9ALVE|eukprot:Cvel_22204.t1-p1 / transcript=Cvel_22204.t1 / gene=Cvel_22204 / organism=Chromera_velia_CCMP2878 / gene_product=Uncharacterized protein At4g19900, putative / transcript_product=Uncharacterized protein At4g19900, putative / location=Cvel_scaffold2157:9406-10644(+) / protein_length=413 / sequence_SO=supercontig / SO=protein_coding / is_pseudo=false
MSGFRALVLGLSSVVFLVVAFHVVLYRSAYTSSGFAFRESSKTLDRITILEERLSLLQESVTALKAEKAASIEIAAATVGEQPQAVRLAPSSTEDADCSLSGSCREAVPIHAEPSGSPEKKCELLFHMIWTTTDRMDDRHFRSIESVFFHHPYACLDLYLQMGKVEKDKRHDELRSLGYTLRLMDIEKELPLLFEGTALEKWYADSETKGWREGKNWFSHWTDAFRIAVLYKKGGVYIDCDVILMNPFTAVRNALAPQAGEGTQKKGDLNGAILVFDKGHEFLSHCIKEFANTYKPEVWAYNGPELLSRVLARVWRGQIDLKHDRVVLLPMSRFYPVWWNEMKIMYHITTEQTKEWHEEQWLRWAATCLGFHFNGHFTMKETVEEHTFMDRLFHYFCVLCTGNPKAPHEQGHT